ncbi:hypothetical protein HMI54_002426 [Coelomomyces lativittatus]|nr:hypothetical protein HMI54_002426 [Coelomomyces lativittatus]
MFVTNFHFHFIRPRGKDRESWLSNNTFNYVLVKPGVTKEKLQKDVDATINNYLGKELQEQLHASLSDLKAKGNHFNYHATPVTDIHLYSDKSYEIEALRKKYECGYAVFYLALPGYACAGAFGWMYCRQLSRILFIIISANRCIERKDSKRLQKQFAAEYAGSSAVQHFNHAYYRHHCNL